MSDILLGSDPMVPVASDSQAELHSWGLIDPRRALLEQTDIPVIEQVLIDPTYTAPDLDDELVRDVQLLNPDNEALLAQTSTDLEVQYGFGRVLYLGYVEVKPLEGAK